MPGLKDVVARGVAVAAIAASGVVSAVSADTVVIRQNPSSSLLWKTVSSPEMEVMLDWPSGAASAVVSVDGVVKASVADAGIASVMVPFSLPSAPGDERIVTLAAQYLDSNGALLASGEASLALVCGTQSDAVPVKMPGSPLWRKAAAKSAVLPVLDGASALSVGGESVLPPPEAPGWHWWRNIGAAPAALALELTDGTLYEASVRGVAGMSIVFR